jgi:hypothetical protein
LWDGSGEYDSGGAGHFVKRVKKVSGHEPDIIDPKKLFWKNLTLVNFKLIYARNLRGGGDGDRCRMAEARTEAAFTNGN